MKDVELRNILDRYERMIREKKIGYFDVYQFEKIIDHYLDNDLFSQAVNAVNIGLHQHPSSNSLLLKKAQVFAEKGDAKKALGLLSDLEQVEYTNNDLYLMKGMIYNQLGKISQAKKAFEKALSLTYEDKENVLRDIALSFEYIHQYEIAASYFERAYRINPDKLSLLYDMAHCYNKLQDFEKSITYYKKYLDQEPFAENVWYNLGLVYLRMERFEEAIDAYDFALAVNDQFTTAMLNKAIALSHLGRYHEAIPVYQDFLDIEPENALALCYIGECYEKLDQLEKAIKNYNHALKIDPELSEAWYGLAISYQNLGKFDRALYSVEKAVDLDDENPDFLFTLGKILIQVGNYREATIAFTKTTKADPYDYEAWMNLAELGNIRSGPEQALKVLKESYRYNRDVPEINYMMAGYYCLSGKKDMLYKSFEEGLKLSTDEHQMTFTLCPGIRNDKKILTLLSKYNIKS